MADYLVRASGLQGIRETLAEFSCEYEDLLRGAGLRDTTYDPESWISYRSFLQLIEDAARATNCIHFGLKLSQHQGTDVLGTVGFVVQQAPDLRTALRELAKHFAHHNQGALVSLRVESGIAQLHFTCKLGDELPTRQQEDLVVGIGINLMRLLLNRNWSPNAVYLPHAPTGDMTPYKKLFSCPIFFNWDSTIITFDATLLDTPIQEANPHLHRVLEDHLAHLRESFPDDYCGQIRHLIQQAMTTGDCSIERVAGFLAVNKRTLQRKLKTHDANYKDLLEEVRFSIARGYLGESSGSLTALSDMLCYSELSAFSNAFRAHVGVSPREWRNQQQV